jgi:hypothetical protein
MASTAVNTLVTDATSKIESGRIATRDFGGSSTGPALYRSASPTAACAVTVPLTVTCTTAPA